MKILFAVVLCLAPLQDANYFPLKKGSKWVYKNSTGKDGKYECAGPKTLWGEEHQIVNYLVEGALEVQTSYRVTRDGVRETGLNLAVVGEWEQRSTAELAMKFGTRKGDTWSYDEQQWKSTYTNEGEEEIEVPAGKYKAVKICKKDTGAMVLHEEVRSWYASGVGLVKREYVEKGKVSTTALKSYTEGK